MAAASAAAAALTAVSVRQLVGGPHPHSPMQPAATMAAADGPPLQRRFPTTTPPDMRKHTQTHNHAHTHVHAPIRTRIHTHALAEAGVRRAASSRNCNRFGRSRCQSAATATSHRHAQPQAVEALAMQQRREKAHMPLVGSRSVVVQATRTATTAARLHPQRLPHLPAPTPAHVCARAAPATHSGSLSYGSHNTRCCGGAEEVGERGRRQGNVEAYTEEDVPTQGDAVVGRGVVLAEAPPASRSIPDLDYLQELLAIQQLQGARNIGFFGTRNMGYLHQQLIEILSYAMVITSNHIYTSGAAGTNAAVIRGALRAERPDLLTVILPQSLSKQPPESQELLQKVQNVVEMPHNDHLPLIEASRICNTDILSHVQQVICFAFHDSRLLMETCENAKQMRKIVTLFYLD